MQDLTWLQSEKFYDKINTLAFQDRSIRPDGGLGCPAPGSDQGSGPAEGARRVRPPGPRGALPERGKGALALPRRRGRGRPLEFLSWGSHTNTTTPAAGPGSGADTAN